MKRRVWTVLLLALVALMSMAALVACKPKDTLLTEGPETGTYYYDAEGEEYLISLNSGNKFAFLVREANKSGEYTLEGEALTLIFNLKEDGQIPANLKDEVLTLTYEGREMRFQKKETVTVKFVTNGGSAIGDMKVIRGKSAEKPADPVRDGYVFIGWYTDEALTNPYLFGSQVVTRDMTLYAMWAEKVSGVTEYTIDYDLGYDGDTFESQQTVGGKLYNIPTPHRLGYNFKGWWVSMYDDAKKLSYVVDSDTVYTEDTTLHAVWESVNLGSRMSSPAVWVTGNAINWQAVGAESYRITVDGPEGFARKDDTSYSTSYAIDFASAPAGDYIITVTATSGNTANNSEPTKVYYKNKALSRVSKFEVVLGTTLIFNAVDHATEYYLDIECGNAGHRHTGLFNGNSTYYNFANCSMQKGGITFVVRAHAEGYMDSVSRVFVCERNLDKVTGLRLDEGTQTIYWNAVPNATNYLVTVKCADGTHTVDNGNKTSYCFKECNAGQLVIEVTPKSKGYNAPEAATLSYNKILLATPKNIRINGTTLTWDAVEGATSYSLRIGGGQPISVNTNSYNLTEAGINWLYEADYKISLRANNVTTNSLWSDETDMRYFALYSSLEYSASVLSWRHVIGATRYEVRLNGLTVADITDGSNFTNIKLTQAGDNTISVRFFDDEDNKRGSAWVEITVFAYTINLDSRAGESVDTVYVAYGDKLDLPTTTRPGYDFAGWYNSPGGATTNGAVYDAEYFNEAGDMQLYAGWAPKRYTVTYVYGDSRDTDGQVHEGYVYYRENFTLEAPNALQATAGFLGWYSEPDGKGTRYTDEFGVSVIPWPEIGDVKVYAYWAEIISFTLMTDPSDPTKQIYAVRKGPGVSLATSITIPAEYNGLLVRQISGLGFLNVRTLVSITIPDTVNLIGTDAFRGCTNLSSITIEKTGKVANSDIMYQSSDGVLSEKDTVEGGWRLSFYPAAKTGAYRIPDYITHIDIGVFGETNISRVTIPSSVTYIASRAFEKCTDLSEILFEEGVAGSEYELVIEDFAFTQCTALTSVTLPRRMSQFGVTLNKFNGVFYECKNLREVNVAAGNSKYTSKDGVLIENGKIIYYPDGKKDSVFTVPTGVTSIGSYAFYKNFENIKEIVIPNWVRTIEEYAFVMQHEGSVNKLTFQGGSSTGAALTIGESAFEMLPLTSIDFQAGSNVTTIGDNAFSGTGMASLQTLRIPATVTYIGSEAFSNRGITNVVFEANPNGTLELGSSIFADNSGITEINLPAHVSSLSGSTFNSLSNLKSVNIENGTHYMTEDGALYNIEKTQLIYFPKAKGGEVILPEGLQEISNSVFSGNSNITSVWIPKTVTNIGSSAFNSATSLEKVTFEEGGTETLVFGGSIFASCSSLTGLVLPARVKEIPGSFMSFSRVTARIPSLVLPEGIERIGNSAFAYAGIQSITLPESLKQIGLFAFRGTLLSTVRIPANVESIGEAAFGNITTLESVSVAASFTYIHDTERANNWNLFQGSDSLRSVTIEEGATKISSELLRSTSVTTINIPASVTEIGEFAFAESGIRTVNFASGSQLEKIGAYAFYNASALLANFSLPNGVKTIGQYAFAGISLTSFTVPDTVTEIGNFAFANATALRTINLSSDLEKFGDGVFTNCNSLQSLNITNGKHYSTIDGVLYNANGSQLIMAVPSMTGSYEIPASVEYINNSAFQGTHLSTITFAEGTKSLVIGSASNTTNGSTSDTKSNVFANSTTLTTVTLPARLTTIGAYAFSGCTALQSVKIPSGVTTIGAYAFANTTALSAANFSDSALKVIPQYVFHQSGIKSVTLPSGVTKIDEYAFYGTKLESVKIPATVTVIGNRAFGHCENLTSLTFDSASSSTASLVFGTPNASGSVDSVLAYTFESCTMLTEVTLPDHLTEVGSDIFKNCTSLKKVTIGNKLSTLNTGMFADCTDLEEVIIPSGARISKLGSALFLNCKSLTSFTVPVTVTSFGTGVSSGGGVGGGGGLPGLPGLPGGGGGTTFASSGGVFQGSGIETLTFENNSQLTILPQYTFKNCNSLTTVNFGINNHLVTIEDDVFGGTPIKSITIPSEVLAIGGAAFSNCLNLAEIKFDTRILVSIGGGAFAGTAIKNIELPTSLSNIGARVFANCTELTEIVLPNSLTVFNGGNLFDGCTSLKKIKIPNTLDHLTGLLGTTPALVELDITGNPNFVIDDNVIFNADGTTLIMFLPAFEMKEYTIPSKVTTIADSAFANTNTLESVVIPDSVQKYGNSLFDGNTSIKTVTLPENLTSIPNSFFYNALALESITLPAGLERIGESAFRNTALTEIFIPASVTSIGSSSFADIASLRTVTFEDGTAPLTIGVMAFRGSGIGEFTVPERYVVTGSTYYFLSDCTSLERVRLASTMTEILNSFVEGCTSLIEIDFNGAEITKIGSNAFEGTGLKQLDLPETVTSIGRYAFARSMIESIELPESVTTIAYNTFEASALQRIVIPGTVTIIQSSAFRDTKSLKEVIFEEGFDYLVFQGAASYTFQGSGIERIELPERLTTIGRYSFADCTSLVSVTLPSTLTSIPNYAFSGATALKEVTFGVGKSDIESVGNYAFANTAVESIEFPEGVTTLGEYLFSSETESRLTRVKLPSTLLSIGNNAFRWARLTNVDIPDNVTTIGAYAFAENKALTVVDLGMSLVAVGNYAFDGCTSLSRVTVSDTLETIGDYAFRGCALTSITFGESLKSVGFYAFYGNTKLTSITFGEGEFTLGMYALAECTSLTRVSLGGVTFIGDHCFENDTKITGITIPAQVTYVGEYAFNGWTSAQSITFNCSGSALSENALEGCGASVAMNMLG